MLNLTLLGTGGGIPIPERYLSSMIINYRGRNILIDCGEGTQVAMREFKCGFRSLDVICITHLHGDHIFGLPGLLSTLGNSDRVKPITIIGPKGIKDVMDSFLKIVTYLPYEINIIEDPQVPLYFHIESEVLNLKDKKDLYAEELIISTLDLDHSVPCIGYSFYLTRTPEFLPEKAIMHGVAKDLWARLHKGETVITEDKVYKPEMVLGLPRDGIKLSFITDTRTIESIIDFIGDSDLFICEGTYGDNDDLDKAIKNMHMTFGEAADLAENGNVDELLLTHYGKGMEDVELFIGNAKEKFNNVILGYDGLQKQLNYK